MHIDQARRIISENMGSTPPPAADWVVACQVLTKYYDERPELLTRVTLDGKPIARRLTHDQIDARRREEQHVRALGLHVDQAPSREFHDAKPRRVTRDQEPSRKLMQLPNRADAYRLTTDPDGRVWLVEEGAQTGSKPPPAEPDLMEADPALKMGPTGSEPWPISGDSVIARHQRAMAVRNAGAKFAEQFNAAQRQRWGQS